MAASTADVFTHHLVTVQLIDQKHRATARKVAASAIEELRASFSLSPDVESAIVSRVENACVQGLLKGIAESNPKKAKQARAALKLLKTQRQNAAKAAAARRESGAKTRETVQQLDKEFHKTISKKGMRVQKIADKLGISTRTVERHLRAAR